jgi:hypothetical protein
VVDQTNVWNPLVGPQGPFSALGVWGHRIGGGCGSQPGDSGGLVFSINPDNTRQVRGIVSAAGGASCGVDKAGNSMFWTEATRIFSYFGLSLAS